MNDGRIDLICDKEGVPLLIQKLKYLYSLMVFEVTLFNSKEIEVTAELVSPTVELLQSSPTHMQWLEAENNITKYLLLNWKTLGL
jgi:hypothetical protein